MLDSVMIIFLLVVIAALLVTLTAFGYFALRQMIRLVALNEENHAYLANIYAQICETNEMLASTENNSFIIASKAINEETDSAQ